MVFKGFCLRFEAVKNQHEAKCALRETIGARRILPVAQHVAVQLIRGKFISCAQFFNQRPGDVRCTLFSRLNNTLCRLHSSSGQQWRKCGEKEKDQKFAIGRQRNAKEVGPAKC
jgi:hypothetical protein